MIDRMCTKKLLFMYHEAMHFLLWSPYSIGMYFPATETWDLYEIICFIISSAACVFNTLRPRDAHQWAESTLFKITDNSLVLNNKQDSRSGQEMHIYTYIYIYFTIIGLGNSHLAIYLPQAMTTADDDSYCQLDPEVKISEQTLIKI